jgi:hypothetical protein
VLVLHERKSRVALAARLTGKTAAETISAMLAVFGRIDPHLRRSITFDNDPAFAQHGLLRIMRDMTTWFCDAHASWQKGGIEIRKADLNVLSKLACAPPPWSAVVRRMAAKDRLLACSKRSHTRPAAIYRQAQSG